MSAIIEVYHAGVEHIQNPDTKHGRAQLDFGPGFYLTDIYEQAVNWSIRRSNKYKREPVVNKYLLRQAELLADVGTRARVVDTIDLYMTGFISRSEAILRLKYLKPNNQICISSQTLIDNYLSFKDSIIIERL